MKIQLIILLVLLSTGASAQLDEVLDRSGGSKLFFTHSIHRTNGLEHPYEGYYQEDVKYSFSMPGIGFVLGQDKPEQGRFNIFWTPRLHYDVLNSVWLHIIDGEKYGLLDINNTTVSSGLFGELELGINVWATDRQRIMVGALVGDFTTYSKIGLADTETPDSNDLSGISGYYIGAGPAVRFTYAINDQFAINVPLGMQFSAPFSKEDLSALPAAGFIEVNPRLVQMAVELKTTWGPFVAIERLQTWSAHPASMSRLEFQVGFDF